MLGMRHRIRQRGGLRLGLLSVFALSAFACFPVLAGAADSSELEYRDAPPAEIEGKKRQKNRVTSPGTSDGSGQSATRPGSSDDRNADDGSSSDDSGGGKGDDDNRGSGASQNGKRGDEGGLATKPIDVAPTSTEDDGSSPLVPILIALAVLAAISIAAVAIRRRREGPGSDSPVPPEAS